MRFTDLSVKGIKPPTNRPQQTHFDETFPGFGIRVSRKGTKSWVLMTGVERKLITLARYPDTGLKEARDIARRAQLAPKQPQERPLTLREGIDTFIAAKTPRLRPKTVYEYKKYLTNHFKPIMSAQLSELTTDQVLSCIERLHNTPTQQAHVFNVANTFFRFCVSRRFTKTNPLLGVTSPGKIGERDRVLTNEELKAVWTASQSHPFIFAQIVQLCILTGMRRGELVKLTWKDIDEENRTITIPANVAKNGLASTIPYGNMTAEVLKSLPKSNGYIFPGRLKGYFWGFSRAKELFDKDCNIAHFQIHDTRRTFATTMASLGVAQVVVEKLLNHISGGAQTPISRIYNRYNYFAEMQDAISRYEKWLDELVNSDQSRGV